ncbi:MAG TPA: aminotransferase class III-fold pyridoxal phosphate-dependent enzyme [Candidatus Polarisedimenticolia bacterium]|nr:aminotransferase class III-fold pyridoxal phosphate-dependent enzyme [Candidatus Polarisedimenticolia bacterium]
MALNSIEETYRTRTAKSAALLQRAAQSLPGGLSRNYGFHSPYPVVHERGEGSYLWDVDGHRYVDLNYNGLSLIHGHGYRPVIEAIEQAMPKGWAWLGTQQAQIEFAETLCGRIEMAERVVFTNSGTEASMLAVKLARGFTKRPLILKAHGGYHGTYSDLEAGLHGQGEIPGHTLLAEFNNAESFERVLERHGKDIAAIVLEPVMYTGVVMPALPGFLDRVQKAASKAGALFVLDDCLMFRLAPGGSAEKFGLSPDIIFLGKFIGGGMPAGAVAGRAEIMDLADPALGNAGVYHGGSFNGNALSAVAGRVAIEHLTAARIAAMDRAAQKLKQALEAKAKALGISLYVLDEGSVMGLYFSETKPIPGAPMPNEELSGRFHLACLNHGVQTGPGCMIAMATTLDEVALAAASEGMCQALADIAP